VTDINYERWGSGPPLLLIHGLGSRWEVWLPVINRLTPEREVIAIDLPGFGASPRPPVGTPAGVESLLSLLVAFLDELGLERPHIAGNSLGGRLALELGRVGRAASVTALSPTGFNTPRERDFQLLSLGATYRLARALAPVAGPLTATAAGRMLFIQLAAKPWRIPPGRAAEELRGVAGATWFEETAEACVETTFPRTEMEVPVTVAWGRHDRVLLYRQLMRVPAILPGARILTLEGCGHVPTYDDPEQVARVILEGSAAEA
jgi:pimeloyl-ACP methyl ester carboxylesterase